MSERPISAEEMQAIRQSNKAVGVALLALGSVVLGGAGMALGAWGGKLFRWLRMPDVALNRHFIVWAMVTLAVVFSVLMMGLAGAIYAKFRHFLRTEHSKDLDAALQAETLFWRLFGGYMIYVLASFVSFMMSR